ncbi:MAG: hypothetical protein ACM3NW_11225 [Syntrophomonadaceae bacterium]
MRGSGFVAIFYGLAGFLVVVLSVGLLEYEDLKRKRTVVCPETGDPESIGVDAREGAMSVAFGLPRLHVVTCSRWPERRSCDQACREQVRGPGLSFAA